MLKNAICSGKRTAALIVPIVWRPVHGRYHQEEIYSKLTNPIKNQKNLHNRKGAKLMTIDLDKVDFLIERQGKDEKALIQAMLAIQEEFHFLPPEALDRISEKLNVSMIRIRQVAAFYKVFSLEPRGKHIITVCKGTACHVRGSNMLVDQVDRVLKIAPGETTEDLQFTLEEVNCLGCCAIGPVMTVDNKYYGNMSVSKVERVLKKYMEKEAVPND